MNDISSRTVAGVAPLSMARDVARIVIGALLAGSGFAILLALTVLSLTVISPPVHSSGLASVAPSESAPVGLTTDDKIAEPGTGGLIGEAVAAQPLPPGNTPVNTQQAPGDTLLGMPKAAAWALILALLAGAMALVIRARSKA